jgi:hypothetical protein
MAPNISARWEMDLSPGTRAIPFRQDAGFEEKAFILLTVNKGIVLANTDCNVLKNIIIFLKSRYCYGKINPSGLIWGTAHFQGRKLQDHGHQAL